MTLPTAQRIQCLQLVVAYQAEDAVLWAIEPLGSGTIFHAELQQRLRRLHALVEDRMDPAVHASVILAMALHAARKDDVLDTEPATPLERYTQDALRVLVQMALALLSR